MSQNKIKFLDLHRLFGTFILEHVGEIMADTIYKSAEWYYYFTIS